MFENIHCKVKMHGLFMSHSQRLENYFLNGKQLFKKNRLCVRINKSYFYKQYILLSIISFTYSNKWVVWVSHPQRWIGWLCNECESLGNEYEVLCNECQSLGKKYSHEVLSNKYSCEELDNDIIMILGNIIFCCALYI